MRNAPPTLGKRLQNWEIYAPTLEKTGPFAEIWHSSLDKTELGGDFWQVRLEKMGTSLEKCQRDCVETRKTLEKKKSGLRT